MCSFSIRWSRDLIWRDGDDAVHFPCFRGRNGRYIDITNPHREAGAVSILRLRVPREAAAMSMLTRHVLREAAAMSMLTRRVPRGAADLSILTLRVPMEAAALP